LFNLYTATSTTASPSILKGVVHVKLVAPIALVPLAAHKTSVPIAPEALSYHPVGTPADDEGVEGAVAER